MKIKLNSNAQDEFLIISGDSQVKVTQAIEELQEHVETISGNVETITEDVEHITTGLSYNDLKDTPDLSDVALSGSYNDLSDTPTIPEEQIQADWNQSDENAKDFIKNKPENISVNNGTLNLQANGVTKTAFRANQITDVNFNITTGSTNGTISIGGADVAVKGLGSAAYTDASAYSLTGHNHDTVYLKTTLKGTANGVAELDAQGKIPESQLPSYVSDVIEGYWNSADTKFYSAKTESTYSGLIPGQTGKIYLDKDTNVTYRCSNVDEQRFVAIRGDLALGETQSTAYRGDRGKIAYDHSQSAHARSDANNADIGYDTTNKAITKTINGSESTVISASTIVTDGGGIKSHASHALTVTNNEPSSVSQNTEITYVESVAGCGATTGSLTATTTRKKIVVPSNTWRPVGTGATDAAAGNHVHGNIKNNGAIGTTAGLPLVTTTNGVITTGSFGTTAGTFATGNHAHPIDISADNGTSSIDLVANTKYKLTAGGNTFVFKTPADSDKNTTYNFTIGDTTKGDTGSSAVNLGVLKSETAVLNGTALSLVTTGEKYTWNNKLSQSNVYDVKVGTSASTIGTATKNPYVNLLENGQFKNRVNMLGDDFITVSSDTNNNITFKISTGTTSSAVSRGNHTHATSIATGSTANINLAANTVYTLTAGETTYSFKTPAMRPLGTGATDAAYGNHTHTTTITTGSTANVNLAANTVYTLTAGGTTYSFRTPTMRSLGTGANDAAAGNHAHGNVSNTGTLSDTAAAFGTGDTIVLKDGSNNKIKSSTVTVSNVNDAISKKHEHSSITLSTTAQKYDGTHTIALPSNDPYSTARIPTSHAHGNITDGGCVGSTAGLPLITTTNGKITTGLFGTTAGTFAIGNHNHDTVYLKTSIKGAANGVAELDANGKVPSTQLPSYVDDIIEGYYYNNKFYATTGHTTLITGETGKIYLDLTTNTTYRCSNTTSQTFTQIKGDLTLGETNSTAYCGDRGKIAYDHSQSAHAPSFANKLEVSYDTITKAIIKKENNGSATTVVSAATIVTDGGGIKSHATHALSFTNGNASSVSQGTEITYVESVAGCNATSGNLTATTTRKKITIPQDTHYSGYICIGPSGNTSNSGMTNPYIKYVENNTVKSNHQLKGGGLITVSSDSNGNTTFSSPNFGTTENSICKGNDSRLSNSRPASDVYSWAKASTKPSYNLNEVSDGANRKAIENNRIRLDTAYGEGDSNILRMESNGNLVAIELYDGNGGPSSIIHRNNSLLLYNNDSSTGIETYLALSGGTMLLNGVKGDGSGIDADLLDGYHASAFGSSSDVSTLKGYFSGGSANTAVNSTKLGGYNASTYLRNNSSDTIYGATTWNPYGGAAPLYGACDKIQINFGGIEFHDSIADEYIHLSTLNLGDGSGPQLHFGSSKIVTNNSISALTASAATKLATSRTLWGQSFNGTGNVSGSMTNVMNITPYSSNSYACGSSTKPWEVVYARHIDCYGNLTACHVGTSSNERISLHWSGSAERGLFDQSTTTGLNRWLIRTDGTNSALMCGNVGIGTLSPSAKLHVSGNTRFDGSVTALSGSFTSKITGTSNYNTATTLNPSGMSFSHPVANGGITFSGSSFQVVYDVTGMSTWKHHFKQAIICDSSVTATSHPTSSDKRLKNILDYDAIPTIDEIAEAPAIHFKWKKDGESGKTQIGTVAQYWEEKMPEAVTKDEDGYLSVEYGALSMVSSIATARKLKEQEEKISKLEQEIEELKKLLKAKL